MFRSPSKQIQNGPRGCRFAAARFPDQAERFARPNLKAHAVDRAHKSVLAAKQDDRA